MPGIARAGLAAVLLNCVLLPAAAGAQTANWLTDPRNTCAVFDADAQVGDSVAWTGACEGGLATGLGTATFVRDGKEVESFTADFTKGMAADGHIITHWGNGWTYDGENARGLFNGGGTLINDRQDRFLGLWTDGKLNGFGVLLHADGSRYAGEWKNDLPNGEGEFRSADGSIVTGVFVDGRLASAQDDVAVKPVALKTEKKEIKPHPFADIAGKNLRGVDGSSIAFNPIEGGIEVALTPVGSAPQKTTFTFMNDRLGTVVEDGGPDSGANVTGFFRLTDTGVEVRYADGRSETIAATPEGGVAMVLDGPKTSCRSWYPEGHIFSEAEKKAALADYASRLGLAVSDSDARGCAPVATPKNAAETKRPERHVQAKTAHAVKAAFSPAVLPGLAPVTIKTSDVHVIDGDIAAAAPPVTVTAAVAKDDASDATHCLKLDSDGSHWGFRNSCNFSVQFAYCVAQDTALAACNKGGAPGSVAAGGFGALMADRSLAEKDAEHGFRWIACAGGAGEVAAHLDHSNPPSGRCERAPTAVATAH